MISKELKKAREYEEKAASLITSDERPLYHFTARAGWLNDPNGFSFYDGCYHLFYQYHPYDPYWGPMHWGHAASKDLIHWDYLPAVLAPDEAYDRAGCFSGSAISLPGGRQMLIYTGCDAHDTDESGKWAQSQCLAISSGGEYIKYENNPVITETDLPPGGDRYEFRDPYIWQAYDGTYRALVANAVKKEPLKTKSDPERGGTQLSLYRSDDAFEWKFDKVLFEDASKLGIMWECPNFFPLDDSYVLIASPMDMELEEADGSIRFPKGNNVCYMVGDYDETAEEFTPKLSASHEKSPQDAIANYHPVDCGLDFYAPQVMKSPDGRSIMIAWMQDPSTANMHGADLKFFGQMTIPRELSLKEGRLIQLPVKELEKYRTACPVSASVKLDSNERMIDGINGRLIDMQIEISPAFEAAFGRCSFESFIMRFACDRKHHTELRYRPDSSVLTIDRGCSGQPDEVTKSRSIRVRDLNGKITLRVILDKWSTEIFINGGEQVMSATFFTPLDAKDITFSVEGEAAMEITSYAMEKDTAE